MFQHIRLHERAVIVRDGQAVRALSPGSHTFWRRHEVTLWDTHALTFIAPATVLAALPADWYETVQLDAHQRAVIYRDGTPAKFLRPGVHRIWKVDPGVTLRAFSVTDPVPELTDELRAIIPAAEILEVLVRQFERGLHYVIEAEKAAAANVILRREDAAATRNMANTAKVIAENPVLMRLKELETMKDIADKIDELKLVVGLDGLKGVLPLADGKDN